MSDGFVIIDRRKNPKAKSLSNRQRFIERVKDQVKKSVRKKLSNKSITDSGDSDVSISRDGIDEPTFGHDGRGNYDYVLPGNQDFMPGDKIKKPQQGGGGRGNEGSPDGEGDDEFQFTLTNEEFLNIVFDGLELPHLVKKSEKGATRMKSHRAGFTSHGVPANLNVERTAVAGLARRIALKTPKITRIRELEDELAKTTDPERRAEIEEEIRLLRIRANAVRFLDNVDLRFNNFVQRPEPITQAVMFCIMDVSYSMEEREKVIAKKFFLLLHLFLQRQYKKIDIIFIRHHSTADEVDEQTFFYDKATGGTVVSTGFELMRDIIATRYPVENWNIYVAQASDGDNDGRDNPKLTSLLIEDIMPVTQYMAYLEIARAQMFTHSSATTNLWDVMKAVSADFDNLACTRVHDESEVISAFRGLFEAKRD